MINYNGNQKSSWLKNMIFIHEGIYTYDLLLYPPSISANRMRYQRLDKVSLAPTVTSTTEK